MLSLEEQSNFLSRDTAAPNSGKIYSLCETLISDLNNYCECMIPLDELNTLNLKLFPTYAPPPLVKAWHVPILTVRLESLMDETWDVTMQRIIPHIDGIRSVKQIALLADANLYITKQCMKHLIYYGCLLLLDIFSFNAIYAPTAEFASSIAADEEMQRECARYVNTAFAPNPIDEHPSQSGLVADPIFATTTYTNNDVWPLDSSGQPVDGVGIVELFAALRQGRSVREWYSQKSEMLVNIDLRRFVTFGIIKGFLYRVQKYAFAMNQDVVQKSRRRPKGRKSELRDGAEGKHHRNLTHQSEVDTDEDEGEDPRLAGIISRSRNLSVGSRSKQSYTASYQSQGVRYSESDEEKEDSDKTERFRNRLHQNKKLNNKHKKLESTKNHFVSSSSSFSYSTAKLDSLITPYLDGTHCFDQICTELEIAEATLQKRLSRSGWNAQSQSQSFSQSRRISSSLAQARQKHNGNGIGSFGGHGGRDDIRRKGNGSWEDNGLDDNDDDDDNGNGVGDMDEVMAGDQRDGVNGRDGSDTGWGEVMIIHR